MNLKKIIIIISFIIILSLILYFGLKKNGRTTINSFKTEIKSGLIFNKNSILYSEKGFLSEWKLQDGFIIELSAKPDRLDEKRFSVLLMLTDGDSENQLVIGQWHNSLMIMNGDDFSNHRKEPKIYLPLEDKDGFYNVKIETGSEGTSVYVDSELGRSTEKLILNFAPWKSSYRLILGNNPSGSAPWHGVVSDISFKDKNDTVLAEISADIIRADSSFIIPHKIGNLYPVYLQFSGIDILYSKNLQRDAAINLLGFIPLGFITSVLLFQIFKKVTVNKFVITLVVSFMISLFIEIIQVDIPGRNSSMLDLILNSFGGCLGYILYLGFDKVRLSIVSRQ